MENTNEKKFAPEQGNDVKIFTELPEDMQKHLLAFMAGMLAMKKAS